MHPGLLVEHPKLVGKRKHRRVFAEQVRDEPLTAWDGESYFSLSWKLECGKTRPIYAGDSLTYFAFEHLMKPVERSWRNIRAILDPGRLGTWKVGKRIRNMRKEGSVHVMLDYDDFNSRHPLKYMQMVLEELCALVDYPEEMAVKLVESIGKQHLSAGGADLGLVAGTLMSGHRCTTFFNTVLNEAYIACAYPRLHELTSMHVGDDVYVCAPNYKVAADLLSACERAGLAMNALKQSVGTHTAEFLRVAYGERAAYGYAARSIASTVNGNWASDVKLAPQEGLRSIISSSWTLTNRCANMSVSDMLVSSVKRICRLKTHVAKGLLTGAFGMKGGPCRLQGADLRTYDVKIRDRKLEESLALATVGMSDYATSDFLMLHTTPLEAAVLHEVGVDIRGRMRCASYRKTMTSSEIDPAYTKQLGPVTVDVTCTIKRATSYVLLHNATWDAPTDRGLLRGYPLLQLVKESMTPELLSRALVTVGSPVWEGELAEEYAWGLRAHALGIQGTLSFADASALCTSCVHDIVTVEYPCYV
jgi:hypothetical protein